MDSNGFSPKTTTLLRSAILVIAPAVAVVGHAYHPWIGSPGDPGFYDRLAAAVAADPTRWAVAHLGVAVGSGLLILAFMAIRAWLREAGENRWSALGLPFVVMGSVFYALLPAMEFAPIAAHYTGGDVAAVQPAILPWFAPILLTAAAVFAIGALAFAVGIARSRAAGPLATWVSVGALVVLAGARFLPVGAAQLYVAPAASAVALWPLAFTVARRGSAPSATRMAPGASSTRRLA